MNLHHFQKFNIEQWLNHYSHLDFLIANGKKIVVSNSSKLTQRVQISFSIIWLAHSDFELAWRPYQKSSCINKIRNLALNWSFRPSKPNKSRLTRWLSWRFLWWQWRWLTTLQSVNYVCKSNPDYRFSELWIFDLKNYCRLNIIVVYNCI